MEAVAYANKVISGEIDAPAEVKHGILFATLRKVSDE